MWNTFPFHYVLLRKCSFCIAWILQSIISACLPACLMAIPSFPMASNYRFDFLPSRKRRGTTAGALRDGRGQGGENYGTTLLTSTRESSSSPCKGEVREGHKWETHWLNQCCFNVICQRIETLK